MFRFLLVIFLSLLLHLGQDPSFSASALPDKHTKKLDLTEEN